MLKSDPRSVKAFQAPSSDGVCASYVYLLDGACHSVLIRSRKMSLDGYCNTCSMRLATLITHTLHRHSKWREELLKLRKMGGKSQSILYFLLKF